jgi:hypothetical protein
MASVLSVTRCAAAILVLLMAFNFGVATGRVVEFQNISYYIPPKSLVSAFVSVYAKQLYNVKSDLFPGQRGLQDSRTHRR